MTGGVLDTLFRAFATVGLVGHVISCLHENNKLQALLEDCCPSHLVRHRLQSIHDILTLTNSDVTDLSEIVRNESSGECNSRDDFAY